MTNWYENGSWYAPLQRPQNEIKAAPAPAKKAKKRRWLWPACIAVLLLGGIIGTSIAFGGKNDAITKPGLPNQGNSGSFAADGGDSSGKDYTGDTLPDDFKEFFENFYTSTDNTPAVVDIERTKVKNAAKLTVNPAPEEELSLKELYAQCRPTVVGIKGFTGIVGGYNWGTGFIISEDGLIVTNTHVVDGSKSAAVVLSDGQEYEAKLIGADTSSDIAVLKIEAKGLPCVTLGDSSTLAVGDRVAAIGNPLGESFTGTFTDGIISAIERDVSYKGRTMNLLQTNTALNEGNSGGPLFNMYGQVIGITNMKMMGSYTSIEGIGFAIPSVTAADIINALLQDGEVRGRTSIGITVGAIPAEAQAEYQLPEGLYVAGVQEGSDAEKQGLQIGDVITKINGQAVLTTDDVLAIKEPMKVGDKMTFTIYREGETFEVDVTLMDTNDVYGG